MNAARRKRLDDALAIVQEVAEEERAARENAPENLYCSELYERMEEAADELDDIASRLEEIVMGEQ